MLMPAGQHILCSFVQHSRLTSQQNKHSFIISSSQGGKEAKESTVYFVTVVMVVTENVILPELLDLSQNSRRNCLCRIDSKKLH